MPFRDVRSALGTLRRNWFVALLVVALVAASATASWVVAARTADELQALRGGLCKIVARSNKLSQANKVALLSAAARAERRAKIDQAAGRVELAQADRDATTLDRKFAGEIQPTTLGGCS